MRMTAEPDPRLSMDDRAKDIVCDYISRHVQRTVDPSEVFIVWKCKTLQNWKYMLGSKLPENRYYELTYNGDKSEWYLDVYEHIDNQTTFFASC